MKKQFNISIPKPCREDWSKMTLKEKGRYCSSCAKTVVDFTKKSTVEIQEFLRINYNKKVCGHFYKKQLDTITIEIPEEIFNYKLPFQKLFILCLLLVMGTNLMSCSYNGGGKHKIEKVVLIDSLKTNDVNCLTDNEKASKTETEERLPTLGIMDIRPNFNIDSIIEITGDIDLTPISEPYNFHHVDKIPRFKSSKNILEIHAQEDFDKRITVFFTKRLKTNQEYLKNGKYRVFTLFIIDTLGNVKDIQIKAPHPSLALEVRRIIQQLPTFTPAKKNGHVVESKYVFPITFSID